MFYGAGNVIGGGNFFTGGGGGTPWGLEAGIALHAVVGCVTSAASGGKCGPGALSAAFSKAMTPYTAKLDPEVGAIASAVIGGTASVLGGGKFANGAVTGAFSYVFNCLSHPGTCTKADQREIRQAAADCRGDMSCIQRVAVHAREAGIPLPPDIGQVLGDFLKHTIGSAAIAATGPILGSLSLGGGGTAATVESVTLTTEQTANLARFTNKLPSAAGEVFVDSLGDGVMFTSTVPGRVPGSYAVYQKIVDVLGKTTDYLKTTVDNLGNVVHTKIKF
jgi:hypothetical protein